MNIPTKVIPGSVSGSLIPAKDAFGPDSGFQQESNGEDVVGITRSPPSQFIKVASGAFKPERLPSTSLPEAIETVHRQVRSNRTPYVLLYQLVGAVRFVPSSELIPPEDIEEKIIKDST